MRLCLVEDHAVAGLEPLTLTRTVFDLMLGGSTLGAKIARAFRVGPGPQRRGLVIRPYLAAIQSQRDPHSMVNNRDWLARGPVVVANGRWVPPVGFEPPSLHGNWVLLCDGQPACARVDPEDAVQVESHGVADWYDQMLARHGGVEVGGEWISRPWDLVALNAAHVERDFAEEGRVSVTNRHLATAALVGPVDRLCIHDSARIDPYTVFDTTNGPITVAAGAWVQPFTARRGADLHRSRYATLPRQYPRRRDHRPRLPDRWRGRGVDRVGPLE